MFEQNLNRLRQVAALSSLNDEDLKHLLSRLQIRVVPGGERVCRQGDSDCSLLIVVAGRLRVIRTDACGVERIVGEVPAGEIFGEIALITGESRSASADAMRDTVLWVLQEQDYCQLLSDHPAMARTVTRVAVQRLRESGSGAVRQPRCQTIAITTVVDTMVCNRFIEDLVSRLKSDRRVAVVDSSMLRQIGDENESPSTANEISLISALDGLERQNDILIYVADQKDDEWTGRCWRNSDRKLLIVDPSTSPSNELQTWLSRFNDSNAELVVLRESRQAVGDTGLHRMPPQSGRAIHFVQMSQDEDWQSLCRSIVDSIAAPDWLRGSPLFASLSETDLRLLLEGMETISLSARQVLFEQGSPSDGLYIIINGRLQASISIANGQTRTVGTMGRGEVIGEISVLTEEPRSATVRALRDSTVAKLPLATWKRMAASRPAWSIGLAQVIVDRLSGRRKLGSAGRSVCFAVQPLNNYERLPEFVRALEQSLGSLGRTCTIDSVAVDRRFGFGFARTKRGESGEAIIVDWLNRQESNSDALILVCEQGDTEWTQRCLRQADQILLVSAAESSAAITELERSISDFANPTSQTPRQLVLVHPEAASSAPGTLQWLQTRNVKSHHHVRRGNKEDMQRLARVLTGRAYGLALSGGGSRGVAHIGIVRALRELGIPIDAVYGTSAGAALAGLVAMEAPSAVMIERVTRMLTNSLGHVLSMGPPIVSLMSGGHPMNLLATMFGDARLEDQFIRCGIVSADLVTGEQFVHERGLISEAARASSSLPGAWPPVIEDGRVYVDGGVVNNLPIDLAQQVCQNGKVFAVDIAGEDDYSKLKPYGTQLSGWKILTRKLLAPHRNVGLPAMMATISRCCTLTSANRIKAIKSDSQLLVLQPPVTSYGMFEIRTAAIVREVEEKSYRYARDALTNWSGLDSRAN